VTTWRRGGEGKTRNSRKRMRMKEAIRGEKGHFRDQPSGKKERGERNGAMDPKKPKLDR